MAYQPPARTHSDGSELLQNPERINADIQDKNSIVQAKIDMFDELKEQTIDLIKTEFDELWTILSRKETQLISEAQNAFDESLAEQKQFLKKTKDLCDSVKNLQTEVEQVLPIEDPREINAYSRKFEGISERLNENVQMLTEPVFISDDGARVNLNTLRIGKIENQPCFRQTPSEDALTELSSNLPDLKINDSDTIALHRQGSDMQMSIITSFIWENGRLVVTDKSNKKLKIFTETGTFLYDILFSNAEPYCVAILKSNPQGDTYAVTFPKLKYIYFVFFADSEDSPPRVMSYGATAVGYSGISRGPDDTTMFATVVSSSGEPRVDLLNAKCEPIRTFNRDAYGQLMFSFPRYVLYKSNTIIVSDHKMNAVLFLDFEGRLLGKYTGFRGQHLVNPFDITVDGEGNVFVVDGKTSNIHVFDKKFRIITVINCGLSLFNVRLISYDERTNRLAITHGGGDVTLYLVRSDFTIKEFDLDESDGLSGVPSGGLSPRSPSTGHNAGIEGLIVPETQCRAPSPGF